MLGPLDFWTWTNDATAVVPPTTGGTAGVPRGRRKPRGEWFPGAAIVERRPATVTLSPLVVTLTGGPFLVRAVMTARAVLAGLAFRLSAGAAARVRAIRNPSAAELARIAELLRHL